MFKTAINATIAALVLAGPAFSQTPKIQEAVEKVLENKRKEADAATKATPTLEDRFTQALKSNPDILLAEAKVREAEAALNKVRLQIMQKLSEHEARLASAKFALQEAKTRYDRAKELARQNVIAHEEVGVSQLNWQKFKAEVELLEAELPYLIGATPWRRLRYNLSGVGDLLLDRNTKLGDDATFVRRVYLDLSGALPTTEQTQSFLKDERPDKREKLAEWLMKKAVDDGHHQMASEVLDRMKQAKAQVARLSASETDKIRQVLDTPVKVDFQDVQAPEVFQYFKDLAKGINLHNTATLPTEGVTFQLTEAVPLGAAMQWFEDRFNVRFIVRDYGIVVSGRDRIPPGAIYAQDVWKAPRPEKK